MNLPTKAITQYLSHYSHPCIELGQTIDQSYHHVLVIPVFNEPLSLIEWLKSIPSGLGNILTIIVINAPPNANSAQVQSNQALITQCRQQFSQALVLMPHWGRP